MALCSIGAGRANTVLRSEALWKPLWPLLDGVMYSGLGVDGEV